MCYFDNNHPMLSFERRLWGEGYSFIAGIDEVGRGAIAGPVVVAAVIFSKDLKVPFVCDSKKVSPTKRLKIFKNIINTNNVKYAIAAVSSEEIDRINIFNATKKAMAEAVMKLGLSEIALIDGNKIKNFPIENISIVKGDSKSASIAAASIIAKVYRDNLMIQYAEKYPMYEFEQNKGYATKKHIDAIFKYGVCCIHRKSFVPVKNLVNSNIYQEEFKF